MYIIIIFLFLSGCDAQTDILSSSTNPITHLEVWMDLPKEGGEYVFHYPTNKQSSYAHIRYQTEPMERVFWNSPDTFTMIYWGREFHYPIVQYSTYSDGVTGLGTQLCYIYQDHIGDTLNIIGCGTDMCDSTRFIVK
jgi:hypothetical protein